MVKFGSVVREFGVMLASTAVVVAMSGCASSQCGCARPMKPHVTLNMGAGWSCKDLGATSECRPVPAVGDVRETKDRIVIWSVKPRGAADSLDAFRSRLTSVQIKTVNESYGKAFASRPVSANEVEINGVKWIDAVVSDGERPGFTTRYLAGTDDESSALVTFSARDSDFAAFSAEIQPVVNQLVIRH